MSTTEDELVEAMIGQQVETFFRQTNTDAAGHPDEVALRVENLSIGRKIREVNFTLYRGEIVGMTGLLGAGQNEVAARGRCLERC